MYRTNRSSLSNNNKPFLLKPAGKDYLWGGNRLNSDFGKNIPLSPLSETWECSTHPDGPSTVAKLVYGLQHDADKDKIRKAIENGKFERYLQKVPVKKDDVFYIEAGTIHAIGAGALIAEIQENSNLTYRLYDYDRVDKNGQKRPLHIDKALETANLERIGEPVQPMRVLKYRPGWASELLCRCKYFQVERILLNTETNREMVPFQVGSVSFNVLLCLSGNGSIFFGEEALAFFKGDCIFVPADSVEMKIHGKASMLKVSC